MPRYRILDQQVVSYPLIQIFPLIIDCEDFNE